MGASIPMQIPIPTYISDALHCLHSASYRAYVVGGAVRDALMGLEPNDYDIATSAKPEAVAALFRADGHTVIETGLKHGTVTVMYGKHPVEITTFRIDGQYTDARHPGTVTFTDELFEDLSRRDFTVNAFAYAPGEGVIDRFDGKSDLQSRRIRCIRTPSERFSEDALRILRALRFSAFLDFDIDSETADAARDLAPLLKKISAERHTAEWEKMMSSPYPTRLLSVLCSFRSVFEQILPELARLSDAEYSELCRKTASVPPENGLRTAYFFAKADATEELLGHFRFSGAFVARVRALKTALSEVAAVETHIDARFFLHRYGESACMDAAVCLTCVENKNAPEKLLRWVIEKGDCVRISQLAIDGNDLAACGFKGKQIGETLEALIQAVMREDLCNTKEALLAHALGLRTANGENGGGGNSLQNGCFLRLRD